MAQKPPAPDKKDKGKGPASAKTINISQDIKLIRTASLVFGCALLVAAGLIYFSNEFMLQKQGQLSSANQQREEARQKLSKARQEEQEIREFLALYLKLENQNIVGQEKRLDWIEALQHAHEQFKLAPINYDISPQQTVQTDASIRTAEMELRATQVKFDLDLLHEGDILRLLAALKQAANDFFSTKDCHIERRQLSTAAGAAEGRLENRLSAQCTVYWLTLVHRQSPPPDESGAPPPVQ